MESSTVGNLDLVNSEEERLVLYLKEKYLEETNKESLEVHPANNIYSRVIKRFFDIAIASVALTVMFPFNLVFGICTFFDVGSPIFFKQTRSGKDGKPFTLVKFRNMNEKKDEDGKLLPPSQRVTKFGKFMRKYSLDELLNFWSVLKGDMSIIGPRPLPVTFTERMSERHKQRGKVRPGLECPRILKGDPDICQYQNQFENDIWYVEHVSFITDIRMLILLVKLTLNTKKRSQNAEGRGYFAGYDRRKIATSLNRFKREYPDEWEVISDSDNN